MVPIVKIVQRYAILIPSGMNDEKENVKGRQGTEEGQKDGD